MLDPRSRDVTWVLVGEQVIAMIYLKILEIIFKLLNLYMNILLCSNLILAVDK